jgi:uncharacterized protein
MKTAAIIALMVPVLYAALLGAVTWWQRSLLYFPGTEKKSPAEAGFAKAQELKIKTADGETLVAWYVPTAPGKPLLLYFHGNAKSLVERVPRFDLMTAGGNGLLAVSYRGYFGSTGAPTEAGLHEDGEATYREALSLGYDPARIVVVGESLGTGVAVALAAKKPVAALILDSPYTSIVDVAAARYWMIPVQTMMWDRFASDGKIGQVHVPLLIAHGTNDGIVPIRFGRRLFSLANEPKKFIEVKDGPHLVLGLPNVMPDVLKWIEANVSSASNEPTKKE